MIKIKSDSNKLISSVQMNGRLYATDEDKFVKATPVQADSIAISDVGISEPSNAPFASQTKTAGALMPGVKYSYVTTFYNTKEDVESNPSPISNKTTISEKIEGRFVTDATYDELVSPYLFIDIPMNSAFLNCVIGKSLFFTVEDPEIGDVRSNKKLLLSRKIISAVNHEDTNTITIGLELKDNDILIAPPYITGGGGSDPYLYEKMNRGDEFYVEDGDYEIGYISDKDIAEVKEDRKKRNKLWIHLGNIGSYDYFGTKITLFKDEIRVDLKEKDTLYEYMLDKKNSETRWIIDYDVETQMALLNKKLKHRPFNGQMYMIEKIVSDNDVLTEIDVIKSPQKKKLRKRAIMLGETGRYSGLFLGDDTLVDTDEHTDMSTTNPLVNDFYVRVVIRNPGKKNTTGLYQIRGFIPNVDETVDYFSDGHTFATDDNKFCAITFFEDDFKGKIIGIYNPTKGYNHCIIDVNDPDNTIDEITKLTIIKKDDLDEYEDETNEYAISLSGISLSDDSEVDMIKIYRANDGGMNFSLCGEVSGDFEGEFIDRKADELLGEIIEFDNTKPLIPKIIETHKGRMLYAGSKECEINSIYTEQSNLINTKSSIDGFYDGSILNVYNINRFYTINKIYDTSVKKSSLDLRQIGVGAETSHENIIIKNDTSFSNSKEFMIKISFGLYNAWTFTMDTELTICSSDTKDDLYDGIWSLKLLYDISLLKVKLVFAYFDKDGTEYITSFENNDDMIYNGWYDLKASIKAENYKDTTVEIKGTFTRDSVNKEVVVIHTKNTILDSLITNKPNERDIIICKAELSSYPSIFKFVEFSFYDISNIINAKISFNAISNTTRELTDMSNNGNAGYVYCNDGVPYYSYDYATFFEYINILTSVLPVKEDADNEPSLIARPAGELRYSKVNQPDSSPSLFFTATGANDGLPITCLHSHKGKVYVFKKHSFSTVDFIPESDMITEGAITRSVGCVGKQAICDSGRYMYWMSLNGVYRYTSGGNLDLISNSVENWWSNGETYVPPIGVDNFERIDMDTIHLTKAIYDINRNIAIFLVNPINGIYKDALIFDQNKTENDSKMTWYLWHFTKGVITLTSTDEEIIESIEHPSPKTGRIIALLEESSYPSVNVLDNSIKDIDNISSIDYDWILSFVETNLSKPLTVKRWFYTTVNHTPNKEGGEYDLYFRNDYYGNSESGIEDNLPLDGYNKSVGKLNSKLIASRAPMSSRGIDCKIMMHGDKVPFSISNFGYEAKPKGDKPRTYI